MKLSELVKALKALCLELFPHMKVSGKELSRLVRTCACATLTNMNEHKMPLDSAVEGPMECLFTTLMTRKS